MGRAPCCEKVGLKKGRWTAEEDEILLKYIQANGEGSWRSLPKNAGLLRCGKSCRLRWINYLRTDLKRGNFSAEEEETIYKLHTTYGTRWSLIASHLPGRTDNEIKNYWNSHISRKLYIFSKATSRGTTRIMDIGPPKRKGGKTSRWAMKKNKNTYIKQIVNKENNSEISVLMSPPTPSLEESDGVENAKLLEEVTKENEELEELKRTTYDEFDDIIGLSHELEELEDSNGELCVNHDMTMKSCIEKECEVTNLNEERENTIVDLVSDGEENERKDYIGDMCPNNLASSDDKISLNNMASTHGEWYSKMDLSLDDDNWVWESVMEFNGGIIGLRHDLEDINEVLCMNNEMTIENEACRVMNLNEEEENNVVGVVGVGEENEKANGDVCLSKMALSDDLISSNNMQSIQGQCYYKVDLSLDDANQDWGSVMEFNGGIIGLRHELEDINGLFCMNHDMTMENFIVEACRVTNLNEERENNVVDMAGVGEENEGANYNGYFCLNKMSLSDDQISSNNIESTHGEWFSKLGLSLDDDNKDRENVIEFNDDIIVLCHELEDINGVLCMNHDMTMESCIVEACEVTNFNEERENNVVNVVGVGEENQRANYDGDMCPNKMTSIDEQISSNTMESTHGEWCSKIDLGLDDDKWDWESVIEFSDNIISLFHELEDINGVLCMNHDMAMESWIMEACGVMINEGENNVVDVVGVGEENEIANYDGDFCPIKIASCDDQINSNTMKSTHGEWSSKMELSLDHKWDCESVMEFDDDTQNLLTWLWEEDDLDSDRIMLEEIDPQKQNDLIAWLLE